MRTYRDLETVIAKSNVEPTTFPVQVNEATDDRCRDRYAQTVIALGTERGCKAKHAVVRDHGLYKSLGHTLGYTCTYLTR